MGDSRRASVNRDSDGDLLGATLVLGADDLDELGIDPEIDSIEYRVEKGRLRITTETEVPATQ